MKKKAEKEMTVLPSRPPIVVVLGHVDHGKTTLLDYIRKSNVAGSEAGEITQRIGAYQVVVDSKGILKPPRQSAGGPAEAGQVQDDLVGKTHKITFIDTPGHEAFLKMRSRGASIADIAVLVVAADDGVMPQTKESLRIIQEAKIPFIVAINKTDVVGVNLEKVKKQLVKENVEIEGYGGDVVAMPISAKTGSGVKDLLEMILLMAEMEKISGDPKGDLEAVIIEAKIDSHRGSVVSLIVRNGTIRVGEEVFADQVKGRIKALISDQGERLQEARPGRPVEVLGFNAVPAVGSVVTRKIGGQTEALMVPSGRPEVFAEGEQPLLKIILRTDVLGSLEAILANLTDKRIEIMDARTGEITESDVLLAKTTGSIIIAFNVKAQNSLLKLAETEKVKIKTYQIIYKLLDEVDEVLELIAHPPEEETLGKAEILAEFPFNEGKIAGSKILEGRIAVNDRIKILRGDVEIGRSKIKSLKVQKESVQKAEIGKECGLLFDPVLDFKAGDTVISVKVT